MGNHEDMMLNSLVLKDDMHLSNWELNGGGWWKLLEDDQISTCIRIGRSLPMAININTSKGVIGICHAQPPTSDDWDDVHKEESTVAMLWSRKKIRNYFQNDVVNVYKTIHGHTVISEIVRLGNSMFIDTGSVFGGKLTLIEIINKGDVLI